MGKPNIVFFFTDDQRFDTIAALGNAEISTPNIDRLVRNGTSFTHAHIPCGTSAAVCMPSRAMMNTGRALFHIQGEGQKIPLDHTKIGQALRKNGYHTFGTGKWHNGNESFNRSFDAGAEIFFGGMADHWNVPAYDYDPTGEYAATLPYVIDPFKSAETAERRGDHITAGKHSSEMVCEAATDFIAGYDGDAPFYAYISFLAPHDPRTMPKRFLDMYDQNDMSLPPNFMGGHSFDNGDLHVRDEMLAGFPRAPEETKRHIAEYYAMITHLDDELGKVYDALEKKGVLENTIIIFAGDNGLALGQHGLFGKQNCYDHSVRVPLIFSGPSVPSGKRSDVLVYLFDIFPTVCDLVDIERPESVEGASLAEIIRGSGEKVRDSLYFAFCHWQRAVRRGDCKLIEYVVDGKLSMTQLFDLKNDPWELNNLAFEPSHSLKLREMRDELFRLCDVWDDLDSPSGKIFWKGYKQNK